MKKDMFKIKFFLRGVTLCLLLLFLGACGENRTQNTVHVVKLPKFPLRISADKALPDELFDAMSDAAMEWNEASNEELIIIEKNPEKSTRFKVYYQEPESQISSLGPESEQGIEVKPFSAHAEQLKVIARTERYLNASDSLIYGRILISPSRVCRSCRIDKKYIFLHEFGHLMGLKDIDTDSEPGQTLSVMRGYYPHFKGTYGHSELSWAISRPHYDLKIDVTHLKKLHGL